MAMPLEYPRGMEMETPRHLKNATLELLAAVSAACFNIQKSAEMELLVGRMNVLFITHPIQTIKNLLIVITVLPASLLAVNSSIPTKLTNPVNAILRLGL